MRNKIALFLPLLFITASCGNSSLPAISQYTKNSSEMLLFESSNSKLDFFLNDFFKRHVGYVDSDGIDYAVNTLKAGQNTTNMFYQEWMSLALSWFNCFDGLETDRLTGQKNRMSSIPVDDYGYVWDDNDSVRNNDAVVSDGMHSMGWPFPTSDNSGNKSASYVFNGDDRDEWTTNFGASLNFKASTRGLLYGECSDGLSSLVFESPLFNSLKYIETYYAPYLELDLRMYLQNPEDVDDVYVWFKNTRTEQYSSNKCVKAGDICAINYDFNHKYEHLLYFPMYANQYWNSNENKSIYQIKVEVRAKEGKTLKGQLGLNSVRCDFDTRHVNNNGLFLAALKNDYSFTGDINYLLSNITRARKAINFYMQMYDQNRHLVANNYLIGHDSDKTSVFKEERIAECLGNGYYDVLYNPNFDFQTNLNFYKGLRAMAYMEAILEDKQIVVDKSLADIKTANRLSGYSPASYNYNSTTLNEIADLVLIELQKSKDSLNYTGFYNEETGRFGAGWDEHTHIFYDFGYTMWNMEAIYLGIATQRQEKSIMDWISGRRTVASDKTDSNNEGDGNAKVSGKGGSTGKDIYYFEFAPRINTVNQNSPSLYTGQYESGNGSTSVYGYSQVQYGGAILYTSFYDLMCRINQYGANDAFNRLKGIQDWYMKVYENSILEDRESRKTEGKYYSYFYYDYYAKSEENLLLQGGRYGSSRIGGCSSGLLGIDSEFIESLLMVASIPLGFFGISSDNGKTLSISPNMPSNLSYWKMENLAFNKVKYDLTIQSNGLRIDSVRGNTQGLDINVTLPCKNSKPNIYVNGTLINDYQVSNGYVNINIPFKGCSVVIR